MIVKTFNNRYQQTDVDPPNVSSGFRSEQLTSALHLGTKFTPLEKVRNEMSKQDLGVSREQRSHDLAAREGWDGRQCPSAGSRTLTGLGGLPLFGSGVPTHIAFPVTT